MWRRSVAACGAPRYPRLPWSTATARRAERPAARAAPISLERRVSEKERAPHRIGRAALPRRSGRARDRGGRSPSSLGRPHGCRAQRVHDFPMTGRTRLDPNPTPDRPQSTRVDLKSIPDRSREPKLTRIHPTSTQNPQRGMVDMEDYDGQTWDNLDPVLREREQGEVQTDRSVRVRFTGRCASRTDWDDGQGQVGQDQSGERWMF